MAQPIWITPAGSLGVVPEGLFFQQNLQAFDPDDEPVNFTLIAGTLPNGIQLTTNGVMSGVPVPSITVQGVPDEVASDITNKFTIRASSSDLPPRIRDQTFTLTITGNDVPEFTTPAGSIGSYYDGDLINFQIGYTNTDPDETVVVRLVAGQLPGGVTLSTTGLIYGYIEPAINVSQSPGYDLTASSTLPFDFIVSAINKNYQFTLEVTDGKSSSLRTFEFFVYDRASLTGDDTTITADNSFVTSDETTERRPFITNATPSNLGVIKSDNYYAYQFLGNDYDTSDIRYAIGVNQGVGLPPGLGLDPITGWLYGYIPDQGVTETAYSFNIVTYQAEFIGSPVTCTATSFASNRITCASTSQLATGQPLVFTGTAFGGITAAPTTVYYVLSVVNPTQFTVTQNPNSATAVNLTTASGSMTANLIVASDPYPFTLTLTGSQDAAVTWLTPSDLGTVDNGDVSLLKISATNRGGRTLSYRLKSGAFNQLPQGLTLFPTGEIAGRVSFNTFAIDSGTTMFDGNTTTWDSTFTFTVNAYAEDTAQLLYDVASVTVLNGGTGYSTGASTPVIRFSTPVGAAAVTAQTGTISISGGSIVAVDVTEPGADYTGPATVSVIEGYGGTGAVLQANMRVTGARDAVSVFKTFTVRVRRAYNKPYQNLEVQAMPPLDDRALIAQLLDNQNIFVPDYIFRPTDPYFGKSTQVVYQHAFGLAPDLLQTYVLSLYQNHYWKNLVLGSIQTAQALDSSGNIIYEVVYSKIIDNLVNNQDQSVGKIVNLAYEISDPLGQTQTQVYPNSLVDMRNQVIDTVGQISTKLPLWMTSKQSDGRVLGFTPAWVICYTKPERSKQIAYYLATQFGTQLNRVDFKVDRYVLDTSLSRNWDTITQQWIPEPALTTFDRFNTSGFNFVGTVSIATDLAYSDVNNRTLDYINNLGGLDGIIGGIDGNTLIFVKQENYDGPPGSSYPTADDAWQDYLYPYDELGYDLGGTEFDEAITIPGDDGSTVNERMAIYTITVDPATQIVTLTLTQQTQPNDWVQIIRGNFYQNAQLRYPTSPAPGLINTSWVPLITVVSTETIFDGGSLAFEAPVDMYNPTTAYDKYLVFPKTNILV